jgi:hypothetical protein
MTLLFSLESIVLAVKRELEGRPRSGITKPAAGQQPREDYTLPYIV